MDGPESVIIDTSTLINFLAVDRADLLIRNTRYRFVITEHVRGEITDHYQDQLDSLCRLLQDGALSEAPLTSIDELALYAKLTAAAPNAPKALGDGEAASIVAAIRRDCCLAIDDKTALKKALGLKHDLRILNTQQLMVEAIHDGLISVDTADELKATWESRHRFRFIFSSFREVC